MDSIIELAAQRVGNSKGNCRLAHSARSENTDEAVFDQEGGHGGDSIVAPDYSREFRGQLWTPSTIGGRAFGRGCEPANNVMDRRNEAISAAGHVGYVSG